MEPEMGNYRGARTDEQPAREQRRTLEPNGSARYWHQATNPPPTTQIMAADRD
jgi:hypothetical protein